MTCFVIWTDDEEDLGFLMFSAHEGEWPPPGKTDCIFTGSPHDPSLMDDPRARFVTQHKGREWSAEVSYADTQMVVRIDLSAGWRFEILSNAAGNRWMAEREGEKLHGRGMFL